MSVKKILKNLDEYILILMLGISTTVIFLQVIMRYVFQNSLSWSEEFARYLFVWQTWLSAGYAVKKGRHLRITSVIDMTSGKKRVLMELFVLVLWFAFTAFLCANSAMLCVMIYNQGQISTALRIPMWIGYLAIPVGAAYMALQLICEFIRFYRELKTVDALKVEL